ncbi:MAG: hypothetical protein R3E77_13740 [Steroidobacteraceae bacterium]
MTLATLNRQPDRQVATLGPRARETIHSGTAIEYQSLGELLAMSAESPVVLLDPQSRAQGEQWLHLLRSERSASLLPIFLVENFGPVCAMLADGICADETAMFAEAERITDAVAQLPAELLAEPEHRLLAFLQTRPSRELTPVSDWHHPQICHYPVLDALAPQGVDGFAWSEPLRRRGLLQAKKLVHRLRYCPGCDQAQLAFVDLCAQCDSIEIDEEIFLHCYTCGHVARNEEFRTTDGLECGNCNSRLRHIGVDYDRALETFGCRACGARFLEPVVKASCLNCLRLSATEDLHEKRFHTFELSNAGQLAVRTGNVGDLFGLIDELNCAHPAYFEQTLNWQIGLSRRHAEVQFGLVLLKFENVRELLVQLPRVRVAQMLDNFAARLRELLRTTDLLMRADEQYCWLLLPQTPPEGVQILLSRVLKLPEQITDPALGRLQISARAHASRDGKDNHQDAAAVMQAMRERVSA